MKLYVGNLSFSTTEEGLRQAFASYGTVSSVNIILDRETQRPRGFAFVEMSTDEEGNAATAALNGQELDGRQISVMEARPREDKPRGGGGGGYRGGGGGGYSGGNGGYSGGNRY